MFDTSPQKQARFLEDLHRLGKGAFGENIPFIIEHFIYAKVPPNVESNDGKHNSKMGRMKRRYRLTTGTKIGTKWLLKSYDPPLVIKSQVD